MENSMKIDPAWTVQELVHSRPETAVIFRSYGIDTCCGGMRPLTEAAKEAGIDEAKLLQALEEVSFDRTP